MMLHAKFQKHRPTGSLKHDGHLGQVTWTIYKNFRSPFPSLASIGQRVSEEKIFEIVDA